MPTQRDDSRPRLDGEAFDGETFDAVVIGAGASGTLVAAQFQRLSPEGPHRGRLALVGDGPRPARGVAYETPYSANLLNVPAEGMSAFPQDMDHFVTWLQARIPGADGDTFAPRLLYGQYLTEIFEAATQVKSGAVESIRDTAIGLSRSGESPEGWSVELQSGRRLAARSVVFAFGNLQIPGDPIDFGAVAPCYWRNPWRPDVATDLDPQAPVLLIGTGLTMADVALSLREMGHRGPIHTLSRHGRLYQRHDAADEKTRPWTLAELPDELRSPTRALRWLRKEIRAAGRVGSGWRAVVDSLRPYTAGVWQAWTLAQRRTFLRHGRNLWDTHRHRMAPEVGRQLTALIDDGALLLHRGHLRSAERSSERSSEEDRSGAKVSWQTKGGETRSLRVARIVNCTGPSRDYSFNRSPLIAQLRAEGLLVPDALRLGFATDADGRFVAADGNPVDGLFTLGPPRIPTLWESVAIPEIRDQALALAERLAAEVMEGIEAETREELALEV